MMLAHWRFTLERRLATILAIDVVGYSRLMRSDEEGTLANLIAVRQLIDDCATAHGGRTFGAAGDSVLAEFSSPVEAVRCGLKIQGEIAKINVDRAEDGQMKLRIGANLGDVMDENGTLYGDGINVAARLESLCDTGGLCISSTVHDFIRDRVDVDFTDIGDQVVKNIDRPIKAWKWSPEHLVLKLEPAAEQKKQSIALLPFENMSGDPEQEYFSDGICEDIITDLSKVSGLFVVGRNSSFAFRGRAHDVRDVGRQLGVATILSGSVRRAGERVRVTAQLVDVATGGHLWAERYDRNLTDIFAVQDEVTLEIVTALKIKLTPVEKSMFTGAGTNSIEAYDIFLRVRAMVMNPTIIDNVANWNEAKTLVERAIDCDPKYARAYNGLTLLYAIAAYNNWPEVGRDTALTKGKVAAAMSISLDPSDPYAQHSRAWIARIENDVETADQAVEEAMRVQPNSADTLLIRGDIRVYSGRPRAGIDDLERAAALDPVVRPLALQFIGLGQLLLGEYDKAVATLKQRIQLSQNTDVGRAMLAAALGQLGRVAEAQTIWAEMLVINPSFSLEDRIKIMAFEGHADMSWVFEGLDKAGLRG
jgi:adenylate cyclase